VNLIDVAPPENAYLREFERPRAAATLASAFAVTALIAAAAGLFSLFSQSVASRRRELGIRTALGATPRHVRRLVWGDGLTVTLLGIAVGAIASAVLTRVLSALLFDVATTDPMSWAIVAMTLAVAIAAAAWHPTRSAVRAAPVALLREE
jgi:ABC-type antimicrobial peptide transport system permease subunit